MPFSLCENLLELLVVFSYPKDKDHTLQNSIHFSLENSMRKVHFSGVMFRLLILKLGLSGDLFPTLRGYLLVIYHQEIIGSHC